MNRALYQQLARSGNKSAQLILDAEEAQGSTEPDTEDLAAFAEKVGAMKAKADILAAAGDHKGAADVHMSRAREFDWRDQTGEAMRAYRDAAMEYSKHAEEACAQLSPEQVKAWHAQRSAE